MAIYTVYMATNRNNGKRYIGVTVKGMHGRRKRHEENARQKRPGKFYDAIRKHGPQAFVWTVLCTRKGKAEAYRREYLYVDALKPEYNMVPGGVYSLHDAGGHNRIAVMCLEDGLVFESAKVASDHYGADFSEVCKAVRGDNRAALGRHFIKAETVLSEDERFSLIQKIDADFVLKRRRVKVRSRIYRGVVDGLDAKGRRANGPKKTSVSVVCLDDGRIFDSLNEAARFYDVDAGALCQLCRGKKFRKTVGGLRFKYERDVE